MFNVPSHIGIVIDNSSNKKMSYDELSAFAINIYDICFDIGIKELTFYGFEVANLENKDGCKYDENINIRISNLLFRRGAKVLVVGNTESACFPQELLHFAQKRSRGNGIKVNILVNYNIEWDLNNAISSYHYKNNLYNSDFDLISSIDLIIKWDCKGEDKLFLPKQTAKADLYIEKGSCVNFEPFQLYDAIAASKAIKK